jgi:heme/copper-type cytochrome/quinol oxidase subunit 1
MNWEMLSAIGQIVAAIGVIPSLIYLAIQIREQNKERRRAGINILTVQWSELVKSAQESREFASLFLQVCAPSTVLMHQTNSGSPHSLPDLQETVKACSFTIVTVRSRKRFGTKSNEL